eukprot:6209-Heterococcus_DN1.PRE.3
MRCHLWSKTRFDAQVLRTRLSSSRSAAHTYDCHAKRCSALRRLYTYIYTLASVCTADMCRSDTPHKRARTLSQHSCGTATDHFSKACCLEATTKDE